MLNLKFKNNWQIFFSLIILLIACNFLSVVGFYLKWKTMVSFSEILIGNQLTAFFSLPKSFFDLIGVTDTSTALNAFPAAVIYWPAVVYLGRKLVKEKSILYFGILSAILLSSSWNWLIIAIGMMYL